MAFDEIAADHGGMNRLEFSRDLEPALDGRHVVRAGKGDGEAMLPEIIRPVDAGQTDRRAMDFDQRRLFAFASHRHGSGERQQGAR